MCPSPSEEDASDTRKEKGKQPDAAGGFGPLKAVLGAASAAYIDHKVRTQSSAQDSSLTNRPQETAAVRNKIENLLSRVTALEALFATPPGEVIEQRRRNGLIRYAVIPPVNFPLLVTMLSYSQQAQGHRGAIAVVVQEVWTGVAH